MTIVIVLLIALCCVLAGGMYGFYELYDYEKLKNRKVLASLKEYKILAGMYTEHIDALEKLVKVNRTIKFSQDFLDDTSNRN